MAPMLPAAAGPRAMPLMGDAAAPGLTVSGLRLIDGSLVVKVENGGAAARRRGGGRAFRSWCVRNAVCALRSGRTRRLYCSSIA